MIPFSIANYVVNAVSGQSDDPRVLNDVRLVSPQRAGPGT